jgi:hypothetical protein
MVNPYSNILNVTKAKNTFLSSHVLGPFFKVEFPFPIIGQAVCKKNTSPENSMMPCSLPMGIQTNRKQQHYSPACKHSHHTKVKAGVVAAIFQLPDWIKRLFMSGSDAGKS